MSKFSNPALRYVVRDAVIAQTMTFIRKQGAKKHEGVVLWLGRVDGDVCHILDALIPVQETAMFRFGIPNDEIFRILEVVSARSLVIAVQVHSHPGVECHSLADEAGALVQHEGALSVVVPHFGGFRDDEFFDRVFTYRLREDGEWVDVATRHVFLPGGAE